MEHSGKHALVTGGGTGIGRAIAYALADAGAEVTISGRREDVLAEAAEGRTNIHPLVMDVADESSVREGVQAAVSASGPVSICVANAGIAEGGAFEATTLAAWRKTLTINLDGAFLTLQAALASLPTDIPGRYIVVSSIAGVRGLKNAIPYTVSKHGLIGLVRGLSEEFMHRPVTFNALCPGYVDTDIVQNQLPGLMRRFDVDRETAENIMAKGNRHKTLLEVDEIAGAALWLCSDAARSVNGQTVEISGGQV